jgi:D-alanyl-D-alanine carboxypeptidase
MRIKYIILILLAYSCTSEYESDVTNCSEISKETNSNHPKYIEFEKWLDDYYQKGFPGLTLSVMDSSGNLWQNSRGFASIETQTPLLTCHRHHSASVSKTYIATLTTILYQKGIIDIDENLTNYLDLNYDIENLQCVTIRQLLSHKSGIFDYDTNPKIFVDYLNDPLQVKDWREVLKRYVEGESAYFSCGENVKYSDTNYLLLGVLLETVSGKSLGKLMQEELLFKFGLNETYYKAHPDYPAVEFITDNYFYFSEDKLQNCTDWQLHFADIAMGHEGMIATPKDYINFLDLLINGKIIGENYLNQMFEFIKSSENETLLGLGLEKISTPFGELIGHSGGGFGTMTLLFFEPETKSILFAGTNLGSIFESRAGEIFYDEMLNDLLRIIVN